MKQRNVSKEIVPSVVNEKYTKGIDISQINLGSAGDMSVWEFSGHDNYYMLYDHFIGNTNCIHTVVFNLEDEQHVQLNQIRFWLSFLQSRIPPVEPLGKTFITETIRHATYCATTQVTAVGPINQPKYCWLALIQTQSIARKTWSENTQMLKRTV